MTVASPRLHLGTLERAALECLAYSDVFDHPLTEHEVHRWLPVPASREDVVRALRSLKETGLALERPPFYTLRGREHLAETRRRRAQASRLLLHKARFYAGLIAAVPFVRMVAVTGALAAESSEEGDDIDYLIVTSPSRVWLARKMVIGVVHLARLRKLTLCPNYLIAENALALADRNAYIARELLQMQPLFGAETYHRLLEANPWWRTYLPNAAPKPPPDERCLVPWFAKKAGEMALSGRRGDAIEGWEFARKARELRARPGGEGEVEFSADVCKGHFEAHRARTQAALAERLARLGVTP